KPSSSLARFRRKSDRWKKSSGSRSANSSKSACRSVVGSRARELHSDARALTAFSKPPVTLAERQPRLQYAPMVATRSTKEKRRPSGPDDGASSRFGGHGQRDVYVVRERAQMDGSLIRATFRILRGESRDRDNVAGDQRGGDDGFGL